MRMVYYPVKKRINMHEFPGRQAWKTDFFLPVFLDILEHFTEGHLDVSMYHSIKQKTMSRAK